MAEQKQFEGGGMHAVEIEDVTKSFGTHCAVADLSLIVPTGSIYGFIGPNGSGKTTTLRMIMRILHPDSGQIRVLGESVGDEAGGSDILDRVAYLPEERGLYKQMKVRDVIRFYAELKGCRDSRAAVDSWLDRLGLADWANRRVQTLSKGMSQKVQFIAAVIARPELVLLDEPFSGLDPVNAEVMREAVLELRRDGTTVVFSTHDMGMAEKMCDFVFMIYQGRKVLDGTLESIQDAYGSDTVRVRIDGETEALEILPGVAKVTDFGRWHEVRLAPGADPQRLLHRLTEIGRVRHFELARPTLNDIFVRIARPDSTENQAAASEEAAHA
jgi:ABC-2 type transport system ATP-binding protein